MKQYQDGPRRNRRAGVEDRWTPRPVNRRPTTARESVGAHAMSTTVAASTPKVSPAR